MPAVSVVLPIYNAEPYLRQCLDSIAAQTYKDIEVLCVNDGSKDNSLEIIREYEAADPRFKALDKPNGGYGKALNYGLARATGDYVSIIEPDDFIDKHMYEHLLRAAKTTKGDADVVKGSYVEYFDADKGYDEATLIPNLSLFMPREPYVFTLEEDCEVFCHHPSIWSAIYRRAFLEEQDIHFVEPQGAGWADNPFLVETLVKAAEIVWVPKAYYYYRQTNAGASSFLKDYRIPFDRLREMRAILDKAHVGRDILAAFYLREFDYIRSVIGEFGFDEGDPGVSACIRETLESMDETIVQSHPRIRSEDIRYYLEFLGKTVVSVQEHAASVDSPLVSYIIPIINDSTYLAQSLSSVVEGASDSFEAFCVDCGSTDRSMELCASYAARDKRFTVVDGSFKGVGAGVDAVLPRVRGTYFFVLDPEHALRSGVVLNAAREADAQGMDVVLFDGSGAYCVDVAMLEPNLNLGIDWSRTREEGGVHPERMYGPFSSHQASDCLFNMSYPSLSSKLFRTEFVRNTGAKLEADEGIGGVVFSSDMLAHAEKIGYKVVDHLDRVKLDQVITPFMLDIHVYEVDEKSLVTPAALEVYARYAGTEGLLSTCANLVLDCYITDLLSRHSEKTVLGFYEDYHQKVAEVVHGAIKEKVRFRNVGTYNYFQLLDHDGPQAYFVRRYMERERDVIGLSWNYRLLSESKTMQVGQKITDFAKRVLPTGIVARMRGAIATEK